MKFKDTRRKVKPPLVQPPLNTIIILKAESDQTEAKAITDQKEIKRNYQIQIRMRIASLPPKMYTFPFVGFIGPRNMCLFKA